MFWQEGCFGPTSGNSVKKENTSLLYYFPSLIINSSSFRAYCLGPVFLVMITAYGPCECFGVTGGSPVDTAPANEWLCFSFSCCLPLPPFNLDFWMSCSFLVYVSYDEMDIFWGLYSPSTVRVSFAAVLLLISLSIFAALLILIIYTPPKSLPPSPPTLLFTITNPNNYSTASVAWSFLGQEPELESLILPAEHILVGKRSYWKY